MNISLNPLIFVEHSFFFFLVCKASNPTKGFQISSEWTTGSLCTKCTLVLFSIIFSAYSTVLGIVNFIGGSWEVNECMSNRLTI